MRDGPLASSPPIVRRRASRVIRVILANVAVFLLLFVFVEGLTGTLLFVWNVLDDRVNPERRHTRYDPDLGWVAISNLEVPNMYGPGVYLRTNSRGFRGSREVTEMAPRDKRRVICSGDSATLGFGVDDDHSWCRLLESLDQRLETVNMGQAGYGVDQAYLWYKRDAGSLRHHVHLLAPITDDFRRMQFKSFHGGYGKPLLALENDGLVIRNVPVPAHAYYVPWLTEATQHLRSLRAAQLFQRLRRRSARASPAPSETEQNERTAEVVAKVLQDLKRVNEERSSRLVLVYLPTADDPVTVDFWAQVLADQSRALDIPLIDLVEEFKRLPDEKKLELYLPTDPGHFSMKGNEYVARAIYNRLRGIPEISRILFTDDGG